MKEWGRVNMAGSWNNNMQWVHDDARSGRKLKRLGKRDVAVAGRKLGDGWLRYRLDKGLLPIGSFANVEGLDFFVIGRND